MSEVIPPAAPTGVGSARFPGREALAVRTDAVYVVFTTIDATLEAAHVAATIAKAMAAPLTVIHFRAVPYPLSVDARVGMSPVETNGFVECVRSEGIDVQVRVYLCRNERRVRPTAFKPHSVIFIGGRRSWWPTASERLRRQLEAAGHFVVFVDTLDNKEDGRA
jgi:hypothetical protein